MSSYNTGQSASHWTTLSFETVSARTAVVLQMILQYWDSKLLLLTTLWCFHDLHKPPDFPITSSFSLSISLEVFYTKGQRTVPLGRAGHWPVCWTADWSRLPAVCGAAPVSVTTHLYKVQIPDIACTCAHIPINTHAHTDTMQHSSRHMNTHNDPKPHPPPLQKHTHSYTQIVTM